MGTRILDNIQIYNALQVERVYVVSAGYEFPWNRRWVRTYEEF